MRLCKTSLKYFLNLVFLVCFGLPGSTHGQDLNQLLQLIEEGRIDTAEVLLKDLSFANPGHPGIRYARALMQTDALVAAGIYKDIVRNHSNSQYYSGSLMRLGEYYYAQGLYIQSRQYLNRLILFHLDSPHIVNAVNLSLRAGIASRQLDSVYIDLSKIIQLYPEHVFDIPEDLDVMRIPGKKVVMENPAPVSNPIRTLGADISSSSQSSRGLLSLQAGAFGSYQNAKRLSDQIESIGYSTRIKERQSNGSTLYLIMVGDYEDRTAAMIVSDILEAALGVDSFPVTNN